MRQSRYLNNLELQQSFAFLTFQFLALDHEHLIVLLHSQVLVRQELIVPHEFVVLQLHLSQLLFLDVDCSLLEIDVLKVRSGHLL